MCGCWNTNQYSDPLLADMNLKEVSDIPEDLKEELDFSGPVNGGINSDNQEELVNGETAEVQNQQKYNKTIIINNFGDTTESDSVTYTNSMKKVTWVKYSKDGKEGDRSGKTFKDKKHVHAFLTNINKSIEKGYKNTDPELKAFYKRYLELVENTDELKMNKEIFTKETQIGYRNKSESEGIMTTKLGKILVKELEAYGYNVILVNNSKEKTATERLKVINKNKADLFINLRAGSFSGAKILYKNGMSDDKIQMFEKFIQNYKNNSIIFDGSVLAVKDDVYLNRANAKLSFTLEADSYVHFSSDEDLEKRIKEMTESLIKSIKIICPLK